MFKFAKQFFKAPRNIGGIVPSSRKLANAVAACAKEFITPAHMVVEIGAGMGNITRVLKKNLGAETKIHMIEKNSSFFELLNKSYPHDHVYNLGFEEVQLWNSHRDDPKLIVSSLPWLSLPRKVVRTGKKILADELLHNPKSVLIQYTYGYLNPISFAQPEIKSTCIKVVFWNFPPATIWVYQRK